MPKKSKPKIEADGSVTIDANDLPEPTAEDIARVRALPPGTPDEESPEAVGAFAERLRRVASWRDRDPAAVSLGRRGGLAGKGISRPKSAENGKAGGRPPVNPSEQDLLMVAHLLEHMGPPEDERKPRVARWLRMKAQRRATGKPI